MVDDVLTPERWAAAALILGGGDGERVSVRAAAEAAGVSISVLRGWIRRSSERRAEDETWIWAIADEYAGFMESQGGRLEDAAWDRALNGVKKGVWHGGARVGEEIVHDNTLLLKVLGVRDERYVDRKKTDIRISDPSDLYKRFIAVQKLSQARELEKAQDAEFEEFSAFPRV